MPLPSLDSEILPDDESISHRAILVRGLFSRRIGLPDSHAIDNPHVRGLVRHTILDDEDIDDRKVPLFATCGRAGSDLLASVDFSVGVALTGSQRVFFESYDCFIDTRYQDADKNCGLSFTPATPIRRDAVPSPIRTGAS